ncbi:hypothetical protein [Caldimonas caldifontis]|uniref:Uncharacterized protein n=1 Tax=Caldimonas caldifontis TaxID=1452508 RepID=A0A2S5SW39_9BURK|nr:hypothetical protein [Caldimonas caldifontis]PPE66787.1 hypothetical protein C1704_07335 [Caldimonas caldifontis]
MAGATILALARLIVATLLGLAAAQALANSAVELAAQRFEQSYRALEARTAQCTSMQRRSVSVEALRRFELTPEELEIALYVLAERAVEACEAPAKGQLLIDLNTYRAVAARQGTALQDTAINIEARLFSEAWRRIEREATAYRHLPEGVRRRLEALPEVQTPFDFFQALEEIRRSR